MPNSKETHKLLEKMVSMITEIIKFLEYAKAYKEKYKKYNHKSSRKIKGEIV